MSNTDDTRERIERLIAAADRVSQQPVPATPTRRWVPLAAMVGTGALAVLLGVNLVSGGGRTIFVAQTTAVPTVPTLPGQASNTATSLPVVVTIAPTSTLGFPTSAPPQTGSTIAPTSTTSAASVPGTAPAAGDVVRWATWANGGFVLQGHVPDQLTSTALATKFSAAVGAANVRNAYVVRAGTVRPTSEPLYAHDAMQFPDGSASLQPTAIAFLDVLGTLLLQNPGVTIDIDAYTDDTAPADQSIALSQARADAVADRLVALGVARERLVATGHGAADPVADNTTDAGREANRRVEFLLHDLLASE